MTTFYLEFKRVSEEDVTITVLTKDRKEITLQQLRECDPAIGNLLHVAMSSIVRRMLERGHCLKEDGGPKLDILPRRR